MRSAAPLALALLALAGCGGGNGEAVTDQAAAAADGVRELASVLDLRAAFEADSGRTRVLLLFSPT